MCDVCVILLSHNGYLLIFSIAKGIKCRDMYLLQCCLICLYIVLNPERFFLHIYVIPSIALFEASASERNALPVPHVAHAHTHTHILTFSSNYQRGCCNTTQNFIRTKKNEKCPVCSLIKILTRFKDNTVNNIVDYH